ncbi:ammonium transporter [Conexibacter sp. W3-3-2]|uniref:Ammonium transporter n=1 Tax=Paraconexibacter algicola TaxID=2133960 RepID=A0A2T4UDL1_9ACTN|nr:MULTISPECIES: ammonium transporter [Solirubrobacterales]MTD43827.1 ammonium transporter [Conexibacter sp. W3-3-2]PTL55591.1 ammonium transporter [Paraconexibacter algicola]
MHRRSLARGAAAATLASLLLPAAALAQEPTPIDVVAGELNVTWVLVATVLVFFMQAGFAFLEIGFSRGKNVGAGVAKILVNFSIAAIAWWAVGFAIAFGGDGTIAGDSGFFFQVGHEVAGEGATGETASFFIFQFMFAAVSLAIVWGSTLERIKFAVYPIFALVFAGVIYPLIAHWGFGGGVFAEIGDGVQDFAGSSVVHLTGATAALAACIFLGPRRGKYGPDGKPRAIPGHSMPLFGLGVLILWLGWFGFNGGSTLGTSGNAFAEVIAVTNLGAAGGVIGAMIAVALTVKKLDVGMIGNGGIAGLVAITAPAGYVEFWAAPIIGLIGGVIVVYGILAIDKKIDDPIGATSAHGLAGIWGTLACGIFTSPRLAENIGIGKEGLVYGGGLGQLGTQAAAVGLTFVTVFVLSSITFLAIKHTIGLRVTEEEEIAGLDISDHGMYGYPEQFIPEAELVGYSPSAGTPTEAKA